MSGVRSFFRKCFPPGTVRRQLLSGFYGDPVRFSATLLRSIWATRSLTGRITPVKVWVEGGQKLSISRSTKAEVLIVGIVKVSPWGGNSSSSSISVGDGASLKILGNFDIGPGVHISVNENACLTIGGQVTSTASGITCNSRVMVERSIEIGADCIIAWDVLISDSDWHEIRGAIRCAPVVIGDNVWIAHGASILKGAHIPAGCIVGAKSLVGRGQYSENSLIAGIPATVKKTNVEWSR